LRRSSSVKEHWRHKRIDAELPKAEAKYQKRAKAGRQGGLATGKSRQLSSDPPVRAAAMAGSK
jgi:hypothetical protein